MAIPYLRPVLINIFQAEHNDRLRVQVQDLEEQNLEFHQLVQRLQEELKRIKLNETLELESVEINDSFPRDQSLGSEIDGSHIPENLRLRFRFIFDK